jgi:hypothetical protein
VVTVAGCVALAIKLLGRLPRGASEGVRKRAKALRAKTVALQSAWAARDRVVKPADTRPYDNANDVAWGALIDRLAAYAALPRDRYPRALRAAALLTRLTLEDRGWLAIPFAEQWAEGDKRLKRMGAEGLRAEVAELVGEDFVVEVERTHKEYGDVLGITASTAPAVVEEADLSTLLRDTARAIADLAVPLLAMHDPDDAENDRAVRHALEAIDARGPVVAVGDPEAEDVRRAEYSKSRGAHGRCRRPPVPGRVDGEGHGARQGPAEPCEPPRAPRYRAHADGRAVTDREALQPRPVGGALPDAGLGREQQHDRHEKNDRAATEHRRNSGGHRSG